MKNNMLGRDVLIGDMKFEVAKNFSILGARVSHGIWTYYQRILLRY